MLGSIITLRAIASSLANTAINALKGVWNSWCVSTVSSDQVRPHCTNSIKYAVGPMKDAYRALGVYTTLPQIDNLDYRVGVCAPTLTEQLAKSHGFKI